MELHGEARVGRSGERGGVVGDRGRGGVRCSSVTALCLAQADGGGELEADRAVATFVRIEVNDLPEVERPVADCPDPAGRIVVAFPNGALLRIDGTVDPTALRIVLADLTR